MRSITLDALKVSIFMKATTYTVLSNTAIEKTAIAACSQTNKGFFLMDVF